MVPKEKLLCILLSSFTDMIEHFRLWPASNCATTLKRHCNACWTPPPSAWCLRDGNTVGEINPAEVGASGLPQLMAEWPSRDLGSTRSRSLNWKVTLVPDKSSVKFTPGCVWEFDWKHWVSAESTTSARHLKWVDQQMSPELSVRVGTPLWLHVCGCVLTNMHTLVWVMAYWMS